MGLSLSLLYSAWKEIARDNLFGLAYSSICLSPKHGGVFLKADSFKKTNTETMTNANGSDTRRSKNSINSKNCKPEMVILERNLSFRSLVQDNSVNCSNTRSSKNSINLKNCKPEMVVLERNLSFRSLVQDNNLVSDSAGGKEGLEHKPIPELSFPEPAILFSPKPVSELNAAAVKVQKCYKSYRTRRNLADCAVVVEELWWKALDFAALEHSSVSFFNDEKPETTVSKWIRARTRAAKVGKGLSKDEKAQKLALQHWLEAIDPRHRYGHNLHMYYDVWFKSESSQPFFYWLDVGDGKEVNLEKCPRTPLQRQCIKYLGPKEREAYEVIVEDGKLVYRQSGDLVNTVEGSKWIFVLSTTRALYVGQKKKGMFQHSSFLAGGATTAAGRLVAHDGVLEAIWPYSGHYHPTEENFREFVGFLEENHVDLTNVKRCAVDDDSPYKVEGEQKSISVAASDDIRRSESANALDAEDAGKSTAITTVNQEQNVTNNNAKVDASVFDMSKHLSRKWSTGAGPRIGCVRDYPTQLQSRALEQVNLSPRATDGSLCNFGPIPSPRPSPKVLVSPRLACMGLPSPRTPIPAAS